MSKTMKSQKHSKSCPVCETPYTFVKMVDTERSNKTGSWRFNQKQQRVCKCNESEVYA